MTKNKLFDTVKTRLSDVYTPLSIYVFGSYAWGNPAEQSDLDLVVVQNSPDKPYHRPLKGLRALRGLGIAKDILVYTHDEFKTISTDVSTLLYKVKHEGLKIL